MRKEILETTLLFLVIVVACVGANPGPHRWASELPREGNVVVLSKASTNCGSLDPNNNQPVVCAETNMLDFCLEHGETRVVKVAGGPF